MEFQQRNEKYELWTTVGFVTVAVTSFGTNMLLSFFDDDGKNDIENALNTIGRALIGTTVNFDCEFYMAY